MRNNLTLSGPTVWNERGEYRFAVTENGNAYVPDSLLCVYVGRERKDTVQLNCRPACVFVVSKNKGYLCITARRDVYALRLK